MFRRRPPLSLFVAALALLLPGLAAASLRAQEDPVVAIVNGAEIRRSALAEAQRELPERLRALPLEQLFPNLLDRLIDSALVSQKARLANLEDDQEVKARLAKLKARVMRSIYLERYVARTVTEAALKERYERFVSELPGGEEVKASHILLQSEAEAAAVIEALRDGAKFAELAQQKSVGPSADQGGDIGYFGRTEVVPEFAEAAFALEPGEVTQAPVKTEFGWHVILVKDRRAQTAPSLDEKRESLSNELTQEAFARLVKELRAGAAIERFNFDGSARSAE
jgi:peptidyl-prolyl cis-trans isomerase C